MKNLISGLVLSLGLVSAAMASPQSDQKTFQDFFKKKFPNVEMSEFGNGVYAFDMAAREQWEEMEEFPPYEDAVDEGQAFFETAFANGKSYADCYSMPIDKIRGSYPMWDDAAKEVVTVEMSINNCRVSNGETALEYNSSEMNRLSGFISNEGRGTKINVATPTGDAIEWYEMGKFTFYAKHGQLNMACADCHMQKSGLKTRAEKLSPALGHPSNWPAFRAKWDDLGSMHSQYTNCFNQVRGLAPAEQSKQYRALEYFISYMSNGTEWNGPASRK